MLLCRTGLYPAKQSESRAAKFCPVSLAHVIASAKFANAPATAQANIFCPLSPEAVLLTGKKYGLENFLPFSAAGEERVVQRSAGGVSGLRQGGSKGRPNQITDTTINPINIPAIPVTTTLPNS